MNIFSHLSAETTDWADQVEKGNDYVTETLVNIKDESVSIQSESIKSTDNIEQSLQCTDEPDDVKSMFEQWLLQNMHDTELISDVEDDSPYQPFRALWVAFGKCQDAKPDALSLIEKYGLLKLSDINNVIFDQSRFDGNNRRTPNPIFYDIGLIINEKLWQKNLFLCQESGRTFRRNRHLEYTYFEGL